MTFDGKSAACRHRITVASLDPASLRARQRLGA
jgi:hypothetical protein